jgi:hypothetical protein
MTQGVVPAPDSRYEAEAEDGALEGLVLAPVDKASVFAAKAAAMAVELPVLEASVLVMVAVLFELPLGSLPRFRKSRSVAEAKLRAEAPDARVGADENPPVAFLTERPGRSGPPTSAGTPPRATSPRPPCSC